MVGTRLNEAVLTSTVPTIYVLEQKKEINVYPCKPQFYFIKVGCDGYKSHGHVILIKARSVVSNFIMMRTFKQNFVLMSLYKFSISYNNKFSLVSINLFQMNRLLLLLVCNETVLTSMRKSIITLCLGPIDLTML